MAAVTADGAVSVLAGVPFALRTTLAEFDDGESIAVAPSGHYAGTLEAASRVAWVFDDPIDEKATVRARVTSPGRVDSVGLFREGRLLERRPVCDADQTVELAASLLAGSNRVTLVAPDELGMSSNPVSFDAEGSAAAEQPDLHVLSVGVSQYPKLGADQQLEYADDDARGVADALSRSTGAAGPFAHVHSSVLTDAEATPANIRQQLEQLRTMTANDLAVVFLAGHGAIDDRTQEMVFLTQDASFDPGTFADNALSRNELGAALGGSKGRVLVLLDACHSGHFTRERVVPNEALVTRLSIAGHSGIVVFAAAKGRQSSFDYALARISRGAKRPASTP